MLACKDTTGDDGSDKIGAPKAIHPAGFVTSHVFLDGLLDGCKFIGDFGGAAVERAEDSIGLAEAAFAHKVPGRFGRKGEASSQND